MEQFDQASVHLLVALAIGFLVGTERGWSDRNQREGARIAGVRTFSLIGLLGGISTLLAVQFGGYILAAVFIGVAALALAGYRQDVKRGEDLGATTAYAMLITFVLAAWAATGKHMASLAVTVVIILLLDYKPTLHRWLQAIQEREIDAAIKLLVISVLMLPYLPNEGYGPYEALNPYWIWWMVVLICGLSFLGYLAIKFAGNTAGTFLTAVAGGLASSTAVTLSFAQFAKFQADKRLFMAGVMIASSIMFVRVLVEVSVVNAALLPTLWMPITVMFAGVIAGSCWLWFSGHTGEEANERIEIKNPFQLGMALKFGTLLAAILLLSEFIKDWLGDEGIYAISVVSGLMDVDAITLSLSRMAKDSLSADTAVLGIVLASATNTLIKGGIFAFVVGFRASLGLVLLLLAATGAGVLAAILAV
tara:strand:+ start:8752 stop:10011 length:1260 start_codon:yes stop_codon:yes gene_type:complete